MIKRLICLIATAVLLLGSIPAVAATETDILDGAFITVNVMGEVRPILVYPYEEDLLFSTEDLAFISGFHAETDENAISFTRGFKTVTVDKDSSTLTCSVVSGHKTLTTPATKIGDEWFLSGAELLPWLNVALRFSKGIMYASPNPVSIWDLVGEVVLTDYGFKVATCAEIMDISSADVNAIIYMDRHSDSILFGTLLDKTKFGKMKEYYELLDDFMLDKSAADYAIKPILDDLEIVTGLLDGAGLFLDALGADGIDGAFKTASEISKGIGRYMLYCALFECDNEMKLSILSSLKSSRTYDYDDNLTEAAKKIHITYSDFWEGLLYQTGYDAIDGLEDMYSIDLIEAYNLEWTSASVDNTWLKRIPCYRVLSGTALQVYNKGWGNADTTGLTDYISHAMLYLYASEQCYRGIIQYMCDNGYNKGFGVKMVDEMLRIAAQNDVMYGKFQAAAMYLEYDLCSFQSHSQDYPLMTQSFKNLNLYKDKYGVVRTAEMTMYMAALQDMGIGNLAWTTMDADSDGAFEYVLEGLCQEYNDLELSYMILDGTNLGIFTPLGAGFASLMENGDRTTCYVDYGYNTIDGMLNGTFAWSGGKWFPVMQWECGPDGSNPVYTVNGQHVSEDVYSDAFQELDIVGQMSMSSPDLLKQSVPGIPKEIYKVLDSYFEGRDGYWEKIVFDVDLDGDTDRVYALYGVANRWKNTMLTDECTGGEIPFLYEDEKLTILFAENTEDSVLLQVYRTEIPDGHDLLSLLQSLHNKPDAEYWLDYCHATYAEIYEKFQNSSYTNPGIYGDESNVWNCTCMLSEGLSIVFDFASDYEDPAAMPIYARIDDLLYWSGSTTGAALCPGLSMGMTYAEAAATIGLTPLEWAPEQTWSEPVYLSYGGDAGCALELYFIGSSEETAVLVSVNAIPIG